MSENNEEELAHLTRDALSTLFETYPELDSRHLLTNVEQLQTLLHYTALYLNRLASTLSVFPFLVMADEQQQGQGFDLLNYCQNLAAIAHYVSCQHQEDDDDDDQPEEHLAWPQQPPFQLSE